MKKIDEYCIAERVLLAKISSVDIGHTEIRIDER